MKVTARKDEVSQCNSNECMLNIAYYMNDVDIFCKLNITSCDFVLSSLTCI